MLSLSLSGYRLQQLSLLAVTTLATLVTSSTPAQCPNEPAGRLEAKALPCPVPGRIGILTDDEHDNAISWSFPPRCTRQTGENDGAPRLDCLFTAADFRNGHGLSLVTAATTASHLISLGAFADWPSSPAAVQHDGLGPAYEIVPVEGRGKGVVARRRIRRGEIVMVDVPAVLIGTAFLVDTKPHHRRRLLKQAINQLPEETRTRVYALYRSDSQYEVDAILGPNSHTVILAGQETHVGLFPAAARINHSCRPNAYYRFSERRLTMEVVAHRVIDPGEEVFISYVPLETSAESRRQYLKDHWGFDCMCSLCQASETDIGNSDSWRRRMKSLKTSVLEAREGGFYQDAINMAEEWLMFSEWERVPPLEPEYHDTLADLYFLKGDMVNATRYARVAVDGWAKLASVDDDQLEKARLFLSHLDRLSEKRTKAHN